MPLNIPPDLIKTYQEEIAKAGSPATLKRKSASLSKFFDWAQNEGHIDKNPLENKQMTVNIPKTKNKGFFSAANFARLGMLGALVVVIFLLLKNIKLPIPSKKSSAQNETVTQIPAGVQTPQVLTASDWTVYAKLNLKDSEGIPQTSSQLITFKLFKSEDDSIPVWTSELKQVLPDTNGDISISLDTIPTNVFFDNERLFLGATTQGELGESQELPLIPIASANVASSLQGYSPANPEEGALAKQVPVISSDGSLLLASESPAVKATEGNLLVEGQAVTLKTVDGGNGNIEINPDGQGITHFLFEGSGKNFLNAQAPNLTKGSLYYGIVANNSLGTNYDLIRLQSGSKPVTRFSVDGAGNTSIAGNTNIVGKLTVNGIDNNSSYTQSAGNFSITQAGGETASIIKKGTALTDLLTLTLDERNKPYDRNSIYSTLVLKRYDGAVEGAALHVDEGNAIFDGQLRLGRYATNPAAIGTGSMVFNTGDNKVYVWDGTTWNQVGGSSVSFDQITSGTNTTATMIVGTGASLSATGTGTITATDLSCTGCITNSDLANSSITFAGDTGSSATSLGGTRTIAGGEGIDTSEVAGTITIAGEDASTVNKGIASFDSNFFTVTSGNASIANDSLDFAQLKDALALDASTSIFLDANTLSTTGTGALTFASTGQVTFSGNVDAANGVDVTNANLTVGGANFSVNYSNGDITTAGDIAVNGGNITSTGSLAIASATTNAISLDSGTTGAVNIGTGANSKTITIGNTESATSIVLTKGASGNIVFTGFDCSSLTNGGKLTTDASGNVTCSGDTGGGGGGGAWSDITNPTANLSLDMAAYTTLFGWTATGALNPWTMNFTNNAGSATTQNVFNITNALTAQTTDINTESLLKLDNADTIASGTTIVDAAVLITVSGGIANGITNAIDASDNNILNAINIGSNNIEGANFDVTGSSGDVTTAGNVAVNGGSLTTTQTTANLFNTNATTLNLGGAVTTFNIGPTGSGASSIVLSGGSADTGCTLDGSNGNLTCSGSITTTATSGNQGWWQLLNKVISPANSTHDLAVGATATTSAHFQVYGIENTDGRIASITSDTITTGDLFYATASAITSGNILKLAEGGDQTFSGNVIYGDIDNTGGGGNAFTGNFLKFDNATVTKFTLNSAGDVTMAGNLSVNGGLITTSTAALNIGDTATTTTIDIGGVDADGTNTINISTNGTSPDVITIGNSNASTTLALTGGDDWNIATNGNITTAGDLALNGGDLTSTATTFNFDIGNTGTLNFRDGTNTLVAITDQGTTGRLAVSDALQVGSLTTVAYSRLGTEVTVNGLSASQDLLVGGKLEVNGVLFLNSGNISNAQGTSTINFCTNGNCATTSEIENNLTAGSWTVHNTANVGKAALSVVQDFSGDLFTASSGATPKFTIHNDGSITLATDISSTSNTAEGTIFYDNDSAGSASTDHLFLRGSDAAWHRIALDMTKYSNNNASLANQGYIEIAHNQNTNDLSLTGWIYDTATSLWKKITIWAANITHDLNNEFNPAFTQKSKLDSIVMVTDSYGTGADGDITISTDTVINTANSISGRSCADGGDAVNYSVTALTDTTATLSSSPASGCLGVGDEVLLINLEGISTAYANVGNYETLRIGSVSGSTVTFTTIKKRYYGDNAGDDTNLGTATTNQRVMLQRVPNYNDVTITGSGTDFTPTAWNGTKGGVMFFKANGTVTVETEATAPSINANATGYAAGLQAASNNPSDGGESFCANPGGGAGDDFDNNPAGSAGVCGGGGGGGASNTAARVGYAGSATGGAGGGGGTAQTATTGYGYGGGGAGGGHATAGTGGQAGGGAATNGTDGGAGTSGAGGDGVLGTSPAAYAGGGGGGGTYGTNSLDKVFMGSGGTGGGGGDSNNAGDTFVAGGAGGKGAGIVMIHAQTLTVAGVIQANGAGGSAGASTFGGSGGGGGGGTVKIVGDDITLGVDLVSASGGAGNTTNSDGGNGGAGRIGVASRASLSGSTSSPSYTAIQTDDGNHAIYISKEIHTPGATSFDSLSWTESLATYGQVQVQTRSGSTTDSRDDTWEAWKPSTATTNYLTLQSMDTHTDWTGSGLTVSDGGVARNVDYFEDEDESSTGNMTTLSSVGSAAGYAEATIASTDLSGYDLISAWVYATKSGDLKLGFGEAAGTEQEETVHVDSLSTWQKVYWDISDIASASRDGVTKLRITVPSVNQTVYVDNIKAETLLDTPAGSILTSSGNDYFQYRIILSTTNAQYSPTVSNIQLTYTDSNGQKTIDADSVRVTSDLNYYSSERLTVTESTLNDLKSFRTQTGLTSVSARGDYDPGTGADGNIIIASNTSINSNNSISGRTCADVAGTGGDAPYYSVSSLTEATATLTANPSTSCLGTGDEVLLINTQGTQASMVNTGNYETLRVESVSGNVVTFTTSKSKYYGDATNNDANLGQGVNNQKVILQRIPNYKNVTINSGVNFYPDEYDYTTGTGGIMFFRASGTVSIAGTIHADGKGYDGGTGALPSAQALPGQGLSYTSTNDGGGGYHNGCTSVSEPGVAGTYSGGGGGGVRHCSTPQVGTGGAGTSNLGAAGGGAGGGAWWNGSVGSYGGGGGGGGHVYGGGGGSVVSATATSGADGSTSTSGAGGNASAASTNYKSGGGGGGRGGYSSQDLSRLYFGGGGGGGGGGIASGVQKTGSNGGNGGGILYLAAKTISVSGSISANGASSTSTDSGVGACGGGGAGGSLKINGEALTLGSNLVTSTGGTTGGTCAATGGTGSVGRIAVYYADSISGTTSPSAEVAAVPSYSYSMFISDEVPTPNAVGLEKIKWHADLNSYGMIQLQTRTGKSKNSTDGTWEGWKPVVTDINKKVLQSMDTHTDWVSGSVPDDVTVADGGVARNIDYFEDEDEATTGNMTKFSSVGVTTGYAEATIGSTDLSNFDYITAWVHATASGNLVTLGFGESAGSENSKTFYIDSSNTWQKVYWDITDVTTSFRDGVTKLRVTVPSINTTVYVDNISAERLLTDSEGSTITSTPNEYIQYRAILTTTNSAYRPILYNVQIDWNNGYKIVQTDANTVRLYNYTGETQNMRLDAIVFGADLAEWYTVNDISIGPGDVVSVTGRLDEYNVPILRKASGVNDPQLVGAISTKAGQSLGIEAENRRLLALAGRIPVKMDSTSPSVFSGDLLTSSDIPGLARKAKYGDRTIGSALEPWSPASGKDKVLILVGNSRYIPDFVDIQNFVISKANDAVDNAAENSYQMIDDLGEIIDNVGVFSKALIANLEAGFIKTSELVADNIKVGSKIISPTIETEFISPLAENNNVVIKLGQIQKESEATDSASFSTFGELLIQDATGTTAASIDNQGNATFSGDLYAENIHSTNLDEIEEQLRQVKLDQDLLAQAANWNTQTATTSGTFDQVAISSLYVTNQAAMNSLSLSQNLTIGIDFVFSSKLNEDTNLLTSSIDTLTSPLSIQSLAMAPIELMAGKVKIETNGDMSIQGNLFVAGKIEAPEAKFNTLTTDKLIVASSEANSSGVINGNEINTSATVGSVTIPAGVSEIVINNPSISDYTLVYVTPTSPTQNNVLYVKSKETGKFVVGFAEPIDIDVSFNWWIIAISN